MIRIFLADDHPVVRHGMRRIIEEQSDMRVVGEATNGRQVLQAEGQSSWDVLLLDLSLPRVNGVEVLRRLREESPTFQVIVVSALPEEHHAARVIAEGAAAFVSKNASPVELIRTIRAVYRGEYKVPLAVTERILGDKDGAPHERLTAREYQVFMLVVEGKTGSEIAAELDIVQSTVSNHLSRVKERLGATSIADIISYAHRVGLATTAL
ncbi:MAG: response regulator transcription factor [Myxococcales bacterium]|nr:response regulator transcription factor [Myxococcales bacterium]